MVFGIGKLAGPVVDLLATRYPQHEYIFVARSTDRAALRANLTRYVSAQWNGYPLVTAAQADLMNVEATAALIARLQPDVVFNATTPFPWWAMDAFPPAMRSLTYAAGLGMWCALDCVLPFRLSEALARSGVAPVFVNGCYPDMVNTFLKDVAAPPLLGIGNMSNLVPGLRLAYAQILSTDPRDVVVRLVAHHFTSLNAPTAGACLDAPYYLSITYPDGELTFAEPDDTPFVELKRRASRVRGLEGQGVTVSSAATVLATLLMRSRRQHHVPGPSGLVGGYPVILTADDGLQLDLPPGLTVDRAVAVNRAAQRFDGLAHVQPGSVVLTEPTREALHAITGYEVPRVTFDNVEQVAVELSRRLNERYQFGLQL
jgi:hypothetical protein